MWTTLTWPTASSIQVWLRTDFLIFLLRSTRGVERNFEVSSKRLQDNSIAWKVNGIGRIEFAATPELLSDRQVVRKRRKAFLIHHVSHLKKRENIRKGWALTKPLPPSQVC